MSTVLDFLVTVTGLRVILYGVVVTTFALGVLCMTVLIVGYRERWPERRKARSVIVAQSERHNGLAPFRDHRPVRHRPSVRRARHPAEKALIVPSRPLGPLRPTNPERKYVT